MESRCSAGASADGGFGAFEGVSPRRNGAARGNSVTTSRLGITAAGQIPTATALASCFDRWKNCGMTSALLSRDDLGQLDHLGELLDEVRRHLPVVGRPRRRTQVPVQVVEDAGVAELHPEPLPVELGQRHQEIGHGDLFEAEEISETSGRWNKSRHR